MDGIEMDGIEMEYRVGESEGGKFFLQIRVPLTGKEPLTFGPYESREEAERAYGDKEREIVTEIARYLGEGTTNE